MVRPGAPAPKLEARYTIPRPQSPEICVSHNGNPIPLSGGRDVSVIAYYQGGDTVIDWTDLDDIKEIAWADLADDTGLADSWSTYWYNGRIYVNSGLNRRGPDLRAYVATLVPVLGGGLASDLPIPATPPAPDWRDAPLFVTRSASTLAANAPPSEVQSSDIRVLDIEPPDGSIFVARARDGGAP
jgi:hypothetical protein